MREIVKDNIILARYISSRDIKKGLSFFSKDEEYIQVGTWEYDKNKDLLRHFHNETHRNIKRTYEVLYIINGEISAEIYDLNGEFVEKIRVSKGDILILLDSGHGYRILKDKTRVLEVKNGPYIGADLDRTRF